MIKGVKDAMTRGLDRTPPGMKAEKPDKPGKDSFLDRLGGADRTEREIKPGREDRLTKTTREGKRSAESETESTKSIDERSEKLGLLKPAKKGERNALALKDKQKANRLEPEASVNNTSNSQRQLALKAKPTDDRVVDVADRVPDKTDAADPLSRFSEAKPSDVDSSDLKRIEVKRAPASDEASPLDDELPGIEARKGAMQDFLQGMQREFGIAPEKIVEAFNKMDEKTLMAAPEAATKEFVKNLDLAPGAAQTRASEMYQTMVESTGDAAGGINDLSLNDDLADMTDEALLQLNDTLDMLGEVFAERSPADLAPKTPLQAQQAAEKMEAQLTRLMREQDPAKKETSTEKALPSTLASATAATAATTTAAPKSETAALKPTAEDSSIAPALASSSPAVPTANMMGFEAGGMESGAGQSGSGAATADAQAASASTTKASGDSANAFATAMTSENAKAKRSSESKPESKTDTASLDAKNDAALSQAALPKDTASQALGFEAPLANGPAPTADDQANVKELLRQAQVVLKKGGGEIKMDLKPENGTGNGADGIGTVQLKVSVENGQVNIQMLTDSEDSKRLLEKSLHELKADLASHSLKVEHMKVDVGPELQKHMDKQGDESARDQSRQAAQDFMGQMRDERQAMRQGFMENTGWKSYGQGGRRASADSVQTSVASAAAGKAGTSASPRPGVSGSGRLNLVA